MSVTDLEAGAVETADGRISVSKSAWENVRKAVRRASKQTKLLRLENLLLRAGVDPDDISEYPVLKRLLDAGIEPSLDEVRQVVGMAQADLLRERARAESAEAMLRQAGIPLDPESPYGVHEGPA